MPVVFGMYVYWDFSGYSDMAIGIARMLGYRVPENFNRPYMSRNLVDFWRRWHITLSEWIRIRLMMKIAGRRAGIVRLSAATVISMALCGLWTDRSGICFGSRRRVGLWLCISSGG
jgi:alginate O-acetyltransferase complex protein AlgI